MLYGDRGANRIRAWEEFADAIPRTLRKRWGGRDGDRFYTTFREVSVGDAGYPEALRNWLMEERGFWLEVLHDPEAQALANAYDAHGTASGQMAYERAQATYRPGTRPADARALAEAAEAQARAAALNAWIAAYGRERYKTQVGLANKGPKKDTD